VAASGAKTFVCVTRTPYGKQIWHTIGSTAIFTVEEARDAARVSMKAIKEGIDHKPPQSFDEVADEWLKRKSKTLNPRSVIEYARPIARMKQEWRGRAFDSIRRSDVAKLIDKVEDQNGPRAAHYVLQAFRPMAKYYALRHESYVVPVIPGMSRYSPTRAARDRVLEDGELRALWQVTDKLGTYGALLRTMLLTGQREGRISTMRWEDIGDDGIWTVHTEKNEKGTVERVQLPKVAQEIICSLPCFASNAYVFAGRGAKPFNNWSRSKAQLDDLLKFKTKWTLHDLRRIARTLMSRAGVDSYHAERVLGHKIKGVAAVYDRHDYFEQRSAALRRLQDVILSIVAPASGNVVKMKRRASR
jgi:integrase